MNLLTIKAQRVRTINLGWNRGKGESGEGRSSRDSRRSRGNEGYTRASVSQFVTVQEFQIVMQISPASLAHRGWDCSGVGVGKCIEEMPVGCTRWREQKRQQTP